MKEGIIVIFDEIRESAKNSAEQNGIELAGFGMGSVYTFVKVRADAKEFVGVALTPRGEGALSSIAKYKSVDEIFADSHLFDISKRTVALALINAIGQYELSKKSIELKSDLRALLCENILKNSDKNSKIVIIGDLKPVVKKLKESNRDVSVFCREKNDFSNGVYSDIFEYEALQSADIAIITGSSLIGSTIDAMLYFAKHAKMKVVAGFSAGLHPAWLKNSGATHVASLLLSGISESQLFKNDLEELFRYPAYFEMI